MSQSTNTADVSSRFQALFQAALKSYQKQTKADLLAHPLISQLQSCDSTVAIVAILQDKLGDLEKSRSGDERLTKWLNPTVNVLSAFSATVSGGVSLAFSPASVIFTGVGVLISTAQGVAANKDILAELFERIGWFFARLEAYTELAPTAAMTDIITQILIEVLNIFGIATKELKRGSAKKFFRKLAGMADLEDSLKKLDRLTQEEARIALSEVLKITHNTRNEVKVVDGKVEIVGDKVMDVCTEVKGVGDKVDDVGDKVEDVGDKVDDIGDKVEDVDDKVEDVGDKVEDVGGKVEDLGDKVHCVDEKVQVIIDDGKQARGEARETKLIIQQTATVIDEVKWNQLKQLLRAWLSPSDPSKNHNIAQKAQHKGTAVWLFQGRIIIEWRSSTGSLLWIHGKPGSGKSVICSSVIQDIMGVCETGSAIMAYFYFDFRDLQKQTCHDLLRSFVFQLSTCSSPCCDILHRIYKTHKDGTQQPSDDTLKECLEEMLRLLAQGGIFLILDALDECPDSSGIPSPRDEVLQFVKELVDLRLHGLHICATSRPEVDIRAVLQPLAFRSVSLHDESGQKTDIANYIRNVVDLSPSAAMRRWRPEDRALVIETLTERADGMFRWVFCQLEALRHCFPSNLRQFLNKLPDTLDETYERMLRGINKARADDAYRLLQCLTVAVRPLSIEELAELLAFDFETSSSGGIPALKSDWRWDDQEEAVLSTCSSLISIVSNGGSRVVQFSHFSVKEYLTSPRLGRSPHGDLSQFHIDLESAQTIMAQACLGTLLLRSDQRGGDSRADASPLRGYAARHWVDHAQFEKVSSRVRDGIDNLFDSFKPHFAAWLQVHDIDEDWMHFSMYEYDRGSPLYYAAFCGFYDLAERLITKDPEQVNARGGRILAPLPAALCKRHFRLANLLHEHGADVDCRGKWENTSIHSASMNGSIDVMQWLLDHGADANTRDDTGITPLHWAAHYAQIDCIEVLLSHNANINIQEAGGQTPLYWSAEGTSEHTLDTVRRLLEHGADPNICDNGHSTPLHQASAHGLLEVARLLLSYRAKVDAKNDEGRTPFQMAASNGHHDLTELLLEHGAVPPP